MDYYLTLFSSAGKALSPKSNLTKNLTWKYNSNDLPGVKGSDGQYHDLSSLPLLEPGNDPNDPHSQLHKTALNELSSQLRELNAGLALSEQLNCAPMFWAPYKLYLKEKFKTIPFVQESSEREEASRLFFKIAFPMYQPISIKDFKRIRQNRHVRQLREVIISSAKSGDVIDPRFPQRILEQVFKLEKKVGRIRQIISWISSAIGFIPIPGIGLASTLVGELTSSGIEKLLRRDWHWFYLISNGKGHS